MRPLSFVPRLFMMQTSRITATVMMMVIRRTVMIIPAIRPAFGPPPLPFKGGIVLDGGKLSFSGFVVGSWPPVL